MNNEVKQINVNDFEVVKENTLNNLKIYNNLYERILIGAKLETLDTESFKSLLKQSLQCTYSNGRVDVLYKETDNSLNDEN